MKQSSISAPTQQVSNPKGVPQKKKKDYGILEDSRPDVVRYCTL
jgi:hypothetical protein